MPRVTVIPATIDPRTRLPELSTRKRRVAAYGRVSTDKDEQCTSYEAQIAYYTEFIRRNHIWIDFDINRPRRPSHPDGNTSQPFFSYNEQIIVAVRPFRSPCPRAVNKDHICLTVGKGFLQNYFHTGRLLHQLPQNIVKRRVYICKIIHSVAVAVLANQPHPHHLLSLTH